MEQETPSTGLEQLRAHCRRPQIEALVDATRGARSGDAQARSEVVGALLWAGFSAPAALRDCYDVFAAAWFDEAPAPGAAEGLSAAKSAPIPDTFWDALAAVLDGPEAGYDAGTITAAVAGLGGAVDPSFGALAEAAATGWPGCADVAERAVPGFVDLHALADEPEGSLGRTLHTMLVENGYDLEVLDREAIGLGALPPALRYLNTRILQMHDVWHLVAGYSTSASHEIAISAFQLAQFGHNYSAHFLAVVSALTHLQRPEGFGVIALLVAEAWRHGRQTPPLMAIEWEREWARSIEEIRASYGIPAYESALPAELFEMAAA